MRQSAHQYAALLLGIGAMILLMLWVMAQNLSWFSCVIECAR